VINCASTYTAVMLRPVDRRHRALGPTSREEGKDLPVAAAAGALAVGPVARGLHTGDAISAKGNHRPIGGRVSVCENVELATFHYPTARELRVYVIQSTPGLDRRRLITDIPRSRLGC
jgi:hypothetical protein